MILQSHMFWYLGQMFCLIHAISFAIELLVDVTR